VIDVATKEQLERELLKMDIELRRKQVAWETPRNIAILAGAMAAIFSVTFGVLGYKLAQSPPQTINVHLDAPLVVQPK
jgi:hypothetical protein